MAKKKTALANRAWDLLRMALYWARKGGIFRRRLVSDMLPNYLKTLRSSATHRSIPYNGEREFSFDDTPIFRFKMHHSSSSRFRYLPPIPCINPPVDFDDYEGRTLCGRDDDEDADKEEKNFFRSYEEEDFGCHGLNEKGGEEEEEEDGIDSKAEEFIAKFYQQMKLQRQVSYLQYREMLQRGTS